MRAILRAGLCGPATLLSLFAGLWTMLATAQAQQPAAPPVVIQRGDAVVSGFSGIVPPGPDLPAEVHPLDRTYLDLDGITARIFDLTQLGGPPTGQLADSPIRLSLKARDIGHVFGIAFDGDGTSGPPNIYLAATSIYGLQIVMPREGHYAERVMTGRPGAQWMPGLFGTHPQAGPGTIWKVDGRTGAVTPFAQIRNGDAENSGAGLGALAYDTRSRNLYVADMETGLIWRLAPDGRAIDAFDHGTQGRAAVGLPMTPYDPATRLDKSNPSFNTESPDTWGFAEPERRVWALAIENERLYYSVADGPKIWSVSLKPDGSFGDDARLEVDVTGTPAGHMVSAIMFDGGGTMYISQRGAHLGNYDYTAFARPQEAIVQRYTWDETAGRWGEAAQEYAIGLQHDYRGTQGGIALNYGYDRLGNIDYGRCRQTLWSTGEHLRNGSDFVRVTTGGPRLVNGLQGVYKSRAKPDNAPPFESWFIDYDARYDDVEAHGHIGNVAIYGPCAGSTIPTSDVVEVPVWTRGPNLVVEKRCFSGVFGGRVRCHLIVRNIGDAVAGDTIELVDSTRVLWGAGAGTLVPIASSVPDGPDWVCETAPNGDHVCRLPGAALAAGAERRVEVWVDTRDVLTAGNVGFRNCVTLNHPHGRGKACAEGGAEIVVKKTGPAECKPGQGCKFAITVSNTGTTPFEGDVLLSDSLYIGGNPANAAIAAIEPPLGCSAEPVSLPFSCTSRINLGPGESRTHYITVEMQAPGNYWAQNCFGVTEPWLAGEAGLLAKLLLPVKFKTGNAPPGGYPSCVWVKVPGPQPVVKKGPSTYVPTHGHGSTLIPLVDIPPQWSCPDGRSPLASGRCPCPVNAPYNPETGRCDFRPVCWDRDRLRSDGTCCPWGTVYWARLGICREPPRQGCTDIWRRADNGSCCPLGTHWSNGACRTIHTQRPCGWNQIRNHHGVCVGLPVVIPLPIPIKSPICLDGRPRLPNGQCPPVGCPPGRAFNARLGHCAPILTKPIVVICPFGFIKDGAGKCLPRASNAGPCPPGRVKGPLGICVPTGGGHACPFGTRPNGRGGCGPITGPITGQGPLGIIGGPCPGNLVRNPKGACVVPTKIGPVKVGPTIPGKTTVPGGGCPGRLVRDPRTGGCLPPGFINPKGGPGVVTCGPGQQPVNGRCIPVKVVPPVKQITPPVIRCPAGQQPVNGRCIPVKVVPPVKQITPPVIRCPAGQHLVNGACIGLHQPKQPIIKQPVKPVIKQPVIKQPVKPIIKQPVLKVVPKPPPRPVPKAPVRRVTPKPQPKVIKKAPVKKANPPPPPQQLKKRN